MEYIINYNKKVRRIKKSKIENTKSREKQNGEELFNVTNYAVA